jgi:hypothetical protein
VTPALTAVYDELVERASGSPFSGEAARWRTEFSRRTGEFPAEHPGRQARDAASWEGVLFAAGLGRRVAATLEDPSEQALGLLLCRAQRGLFEPLVRGKFRSVRDLLGGGEFLLLERDEVSRSIGEVEHNLFVGRIVAGADGCAVLPGRVWLPEEATPLLPPLLAAARERNLGSEVFLDALLRMDHALATMSRVKPQYAFRSEALDERPPPSRPAPSRRP